LGGYGELHRLRPNYNNGKNESARCQFPSGFSLYFRAALLKIPAVSQSPIYLHSTGDERHYLCYIAHLSFQI